ncbi:MAG: class I SAM-dependent methyltransferase [Dehalococcoidia bacterium]|nr:class I SAM-dependent methyltransferase [Dehalococcoidia bacterium]
MTRSAQPLEKTATVSGMFTRIAGRYDLMNRLMSGGQDQAWRRMTALLAAPAQVDLALDVATGTADLALALAERAKHVVGADPSEGMLRLGEQKVVAAGAGGRIGLVRCDSQWLPYGAGTFDCATVAFGIRNMADPVLAFSEMRRVVRAGGRVVCLEIMPPSIGLLGRAYQVYLTRFIPLLGGWLSHEPAAYRYLSDSVLAFRTPDELRDMMTEAGLRNVRYQTLNLGTIALHVGEA